MDVEFLNVPLSIPQHWFGTLGISLVNDNNMDKSLHFEMSKVVYITCCDFEYSGSPLKYWPKLLRFVSFVLYMTSNPMRNCWSNRSKFDVEADGQKSLNLGRNCRSPSQKKSTFFEEHALTSFRLRKNERYFYFPST